MYSDTTRILYVRDISTSLLAERGDPREVGVLRTDEGRQVHRRHGVRIGTWTDISKKSWMFRERSEPSGSKVFRTVGVRRLHTERGPPKYQTVFPAAGDVS